MQEFAIVETEKQCESEVTTSYATLKDYIHVREYYSTTNKKVEDADQEKYTSHRLKINEDTEEVNTIIFDRAIAKHSIEIYLEKDNKEYYTMILRHEAKELINFLKEEFDL